MWSAEKRKVKVLKNQGHGGTLTKVRNAYVKHWIEQIGIPVGMSNNCFPPFICLLIQYLSNIQKKLIKVYYIDMTL